MTLKSSSDSNVSSGTTTTTTTGSTTHLINHKCVLVKAPRDNESFTADEHCEIQTETFDISSSTACVLASDHVVVKVQAITIDAFIRVMLHPADDNGDHANKVHGAIQVGQVIPAVAIGTVVMSNSRSFPVGKRVSGLFGGQTYATVPDKDLMSVMSIPGVPLYKSLNLFGLSGLTAYVGVYRVSRAPPRRGETVVVTAAAGATGSIAAQLAKRRGARVIGVAGGDEKCRFLVDGLGLDGAIDYKDPARSLRDQFIDQCPNGIDFLYDNVGGDCLDEALFHIAKRGRVVICGAISQYNINGAAVKKQGPSNYLRLAEQSASMAGFVVLDYPLGMVMGLFHLAYLYFRNRIQSYEQVYHGIEQFPKTLQALFEGKNIGKPIIAID